MQNVCRVMMISVFVVSSALAKPGDGLTNSTRIRVQGNSGVAPATIKVKAAILRVCDEIQSEVVSGAGTESDPLEETNLSDLTLLTAALDYCQSL